MKYGLLVNVSVNFDWRRIELAVGRACDLYGQQGGNAKLWWFFEAPADVRLFAELIRAHFPNAAVTVLSVGGSECY